MIAMHAACFCAALHWHMATVKVHCKHPIKMHFNCWRIPTTVGRVPMFAMPGNGASWPSTASPATRGSDGAVVFAVGRRAYGCALSHRGPAPGMARKRIFCQTFTARSQVVIAEPGARRLAADAPHLRQKVCVLVISKPCSMPRRSSVITRIAF